MKPTLETTLLACSDLWQPETLGYLLGQPLMAILMHLAL